MKGPYGHDCLSPQRLVELLSPLQERVRIVPTNRGLSIFDGDNQVGGVVFKGEGDIAWWGPE